MWVKKVIYITPWMHDEYPWASGETERVGDLTKEAKGQLNKVISDILIPEVKDSPLAYRTTHKLSPSYDSLDYLRTKFRKATDEKFTYGNFVENPWNIEDIVSSTKNSEAVVFGLIQQDLQNILESLKNNWYDVIDKNNIKHRENVYVVTVDLNNKKSNFSEFPYGK